MKKRSLFGVVALVFSFLLMPTAALATDAGQWADNLAGQTGSFFNLALQIGFLIGLIVFLSGLYFFYLDNKQPNQGHAKKGLVGVLVGAALLAAPFLLDVGTETMGGGAGGTEYVRPHLQ